MKIDYISDLHIDFYIKETSNIEKLNSLIESLISKILNNDLTNRDILIIAGDLGHYFSMDSRFLIRMKEIYNEVILVGGNHDLYLVSNNQQSKYQYDSFNRQREMKYFCKSKEIHYLDGNTVNIRGINFSGLAMSWDMEYARSLFDDISVGEVMGHWENVMNDANLIFQDGKRNMKIPVAYGGYYKEVSFKPLDYFMTQYEKLSNIMDTDVMITHYGPKIPDCLPDYYKNITSTFYFFDGLSIIDKLKPKYWVYGHTHRIINETYNGCNLLCNPFGYPNEVKGSGLRTFEIEEL